MKRKQIFINRKAVKRSLMGHSQAGTRALLIREITNIKNI